MVNLETNYSFTNIRKCNNSFKWSTDEGKTWTFLHIPTGCYELKAINAEITRIRGNSEIAILPNVNILQCILTVVGAKCKISFDTPNSLASVLGFKQDIVYGVGRYASEKLQFNFFNFQFHIFSNHKPQIQIYYIKKHVILSHKYIYKKRKINKTTKRQYFHRRQGYKILHSTKQLKSK